ncbi:MAG: hypothetical protein AB4426_31065 [Xenococcaceae cyanobacterium]
MPTRWRWYIMAEQEHRPTQDEVQRGCLECPSWPMRGNVTMVC